MAVLVYGTSDSQKTGKLEQYWMATMSIGNTYRHGLTVDSNENIYVASYDGKVGIIKIDKNANILWQKKYDQGFTNEYPYGLTIGPDNHIYMTGQIYQSGSPYYARGILQKIDLNGDSVWNRNLGSRSNNTTEDSSNNVAFDSSSNIYVGAALGAWWGSNAGYWLKYNSSGVYQSYAIHNTSGSQSGQIKGVGTDSSDNFYTAGQLPNNLLVVSKWNSATTLQWSVSISSGFSGPSHYLEKMIADSSGNTYAIGRIGYTSGNPIPQAVFLAKINTSGGIVWGRYYYANYSGTGDAMDVFYDSINNEIWVSGNSNNTSANRGVPWLVRVDGNGNTLGSWTVIKSDSTYPTYSNPNVKRVFVKGSNVYFTVSGNDSTFLNGQTLLVKAPRTSIPTGTYTVGSVSFRIVASSVTTLSSPTMSLGAGGVTKYTQSDPGRADRAVTTTNTGYTLTKQNL